MQPTQDSKDLSRWQNSRGAISPNAPAYDDGQYSKRTQNQYRRVMQPANRAVKAPYRGNVGNVGNAGAGDSFDYNQAENQNIDVRNTEDEEDVMYEAEINGPYASNSQKSKRHVKEDRRSKMFTDEDIVQNNEKDSSEYNAADTETSEKEINKNIKRDAPNWSNQQIVALKSSLAALQENNAEYDHLKSILTDMGLIETNPVKRESSKDEKEDENLSVKEIAMKKNEKKRSSEVADDKQASGEKRFVNENDNEEEPAISTEKAVYKKNKNSDDVLIDSEEKTIDEDRKKRDSSSNVAATNTDIMKGLEKSGDLTVSGNKSPLVSDETNDSDLSSNEKLSATVSEKDKLSKRNIDKEYDEYEQMIEAQIEEKINAIKDKVKRAILTQKQRHARNKRQATLADSESKGLNSAMISKESLQPHVRTRRQLNSTIKNVQKEIHEEKNAKSRNSMSNNFFVDISSDEYVKNTNLDKTDFNRDKSEKDAITNINNSNNLSNLTNDMLEKNTLLQKLININNESRNQIVSLPTNYVFNHDETAILLKNKPFNQTQTIINNDLQSSPKDKKDYVNNIKSTNNTYALDFYQQTHLRNAISNKVDKVPHSDDIKGDMNNVKHFLINNSYAHARNRREINKPNIEAKSNLRDMSAQFNSEVNPQLNVLKRVKRKAENEKDQTDAQSALEKHKITKENIDEKARQQKQARKRRSNVVMPERKIVFRPYLSRQDEEENIEGGVFDNADEPTYVEKRDVGEQDYIVDENLKEPYKNNMPANQRLIRSRDSSDYAGDYKSGDYEQSGFKKANPQFETEPFDRDKRDSENSQMHGGMIANRKSAVKNKAVADSKQNAQAIDSSEQEDANDSENEFFGGLPQNYQEGELNRYKRVKRNNENKLKNVT